MCFVVGMGDYLMKNNLHAGYLPQDRINIIKDDFKMPDDWKPDKIIQLAIEKYSEIQAHYVPSAVLLAALEQGQRVSAQIMLSYVEQLKIAADSVKDSMVALGSNLSSAEITELQIKNEAVYVTLKRIIDLTKTLPKTIVDMKMLKSEVRKEEALMPTHKDGSTVGLFESPETTPTYEKVTN